MKKLSLFIAMIAYCGLNQTLAQWNTIGNNIYNTNTGNVGIGNSSPTTLLHVQKNITEPTITIQNLGGSGGATYTMIDNASGANWKFKATLSGGFKIRDHANLMDVIVIEPGSFANALYIKSTDNVGIGTAAPNNSAILDLQSTNKGFLLPRLTEAQIGAISNPADGLFVYCTTDGKLYIYVAMIGQWKEINYGTETIDPPFPCGSSVIINHIEGDVAPVNKTVTYGTVTNIPGESSKCWITSNLGADHQANAVNDTTEASAGWYWQFNRKQGYKHNGLTRTPNTTWITSISENSNWSMANDPCSNEIGSGWRLPTKTEWINVDAGGSWTTWNDPWESPLKIHAAGDLLVSNGSLINRGVRGIYWSSEQSGNSNGWDLSIISSICHIDDDQKAYGFSLRCIRD